MWENIEENETYGDTKLVFIWLQRKVSDSDVQDGLCFHSILFRGYAVLFLSFKNSDGLHMTKTASDDFASQCHGHVRDWFQELSKTAGKMFGDPQISIGVYINILVSWSLKTKTNKSWLK